MRTSVSASGVVAICCIAFVCHALGMAAATESEESLNLWNDCPAWSPDGHHIAFQSDDGDNQDIWLVHPDGTGLERVTTHPADDFEPQWRADSSSLYFASRRTGNKRLWSRNLSTGEETQALDKAFVDYSVAHAGDRVILDAKRGETYGLLIVSATTGADMMWLASPGCWPCWSPDDTQSAFIRADGDVWVRNTADRSQLRRVTNLATQSVPLTRPDWSANGYIAFDRQEKLYKVKPDGTELSCVFQDTSGGWVSSPSWSPDGSTLVFRRLLGDSNLLWKINADGTGLTQITHQVAEPTFAPDEGTYNSNQTVTISCSTPGATIRYTTDGTDPTETSTQYTAPITIDQTKTLKASAWKTDYFPSGVKIAEYTVQVAMPSHP